MLTVLLTTTPANSELPKGYRVNVNTANERQCYDLEGYKSLLKLDVTTTTLLKEKDLQLQTISNLQDSKKYLEGALQTQKESTTLLKQDNDRMFGMWKDENERRLKAENRPAWGSSFAWIVAGAATLTTAILTTVLVLEVRTN